MNHIEYLICQTQGEIYEYQAKQGYDMALFSDLYLKSDFCRRAFDTIYSRFQCADELECLDFIMPEIGDKCRKIPDGYFSGDIAYWIGFTYRQLYLKTGIASNILADKVSFDVMCRYYQGLHTIDEDMAMDIIIKDFKLYR